MQPNSRLTQNIRYALHSYLFHPDRECVRKWSKPIVNGDTFHLFLCNDGRLEIREQNSKKQVWAFDHGKRINPIRLPDLYTCTDDIIQCVTEVMTKEDQSKCRSLILTQPIESPFYDRVRSACIKTIGYQEWKKAEEKLVYRYLSYIIDYSTEKIALKLKSNQP